VRSSRTSLRVRLAALLAGAATVGALVTAGATTAHAADTPLRDLAAAKGKAMGTAVTGSKLTGTYGDIAGAQFNWLTPGNAMKWGSVEPTQGTFNWTEADQIVAFAEAHGQEVRGHTLVWHSQNPSWLTNGTWTSAQLSTLLDNHIATEVGRYKGRLAAWDVVNEPFNEDGTYRQTLWYNGLGTGYIAQALTAARAADPDAKLYINDYNVEGVNAKSTALYNLVKSLKEQGVPIDGVGLQAHLILGQVPSTLQQNIQRFADLGVDVAITELDIRMTLPSDSAKLTQQAADYKAVMNACVAVARCTGVTVWGFTDSDSWIPSTFPGQGAATPYDENYAPKPAYYAIAEALGGTTTPPTGACTATYSVANQWNTGFTGQVRIACSGAALSSWKVSWTYGAGQQITQAWNATCTQTGTAVSCVNASYNGTVPDGGSVTFGFNASWSGSNPVPTVTLG
jgi:endo-1,4-beta-xylanase